MASEVPVAVAVIVEPQVVQEQSAVEAEAEVKAAVVLTVGKSLFTAEGAVVFAVLVLRAGHNNMYGDGGGGWRVCLFCVVRVWWWWRWWWWGGEVQRGTRWCAGASSAARAGAWGKQRGTR